MPGQLASNCKFGDYSVNYDVVIKNCSFFSYFGVEPMTNWIGIEEGQTKSLQ